jgi:mono/diheme cytochrome c family protein
MLRTAFGAGALAWCALTRVFAQDASSISTLRGRDLYLAACASCHADDGTGAPQSTVGFDVPLPDFSDCSFATPEADPDWASIIRGGGPVRAFARNMPAFGRALSDDQIASVLDYLRTFCTDRRWPRGELNLPRPLFTEKAFPENESVLAGSVGRNPTSVAVEFLYERRIGARGQYEIVVPLEQQRSTDGVWTRGLGDVEVAYKHAVAHSLSRGSILSVGTEVGLPTGNAARGFGSGNTAVKPFVAFGQLLPSDAFLHSFGAAEVFFPRGATETFWRTAIGKTITQGPDGRAWSPMVEALAERELERGAKTLWDVVPQVQVSLSTRQHVLFSAGVRIPVNEREDRKPSFAFYVLWDWFDGGLFDGW